ncbi:ABC transporter permease subunit [Paenibacillus doosanensis]|uniref:Multiple-sugar transport system permease YteP n=1 Tax=Paenibacillus konkukensis TaxID=2020716 RepID=A0ABY4RNG9_9BACL|nr:MULTISPECIES: ABC transporter permease subunit [Paenibacillus]MCS7462104.1 ABC transporter permease subunit [Paenibacillus doosanensis]UQZ83515.1 putative multiple-sugar transport system permease YteP [Paenibacillus konkukensis]
MNIKSYYKHYHLMLLPGVLFLIVFHIVPMFGVVIAFQDFKIGRGIWDSPWIGLENFTYMFQIKDSGLIFYNTVFIAVCKIVAHLVIPLIFAILLNEVRFMMFKRWVQTIVYLPHFLSWVILAGVVIDMLSLDGFFNQLVKAAGHEPILFLASNRWFPAIIVSSDIWKEFGFAAIIYLAALAGINPSLYEAAEMDGANRLQQLFYITLPSLVPTVVLLATLSIGNVLNAGFDQIFNLYNPLVYESGDIIDTYVYRVGLVQAQYGFATAVSLLKSVIGFMLIIVSYRVAYKYANYRIF